MEPRKFVEPPDPRVRQFPWSTRGYKGCTFTAGTRVRMRFRDVLAVLNGNVVKPAIPDAEPYFLLVLMPAGKPYSKGTGRRFILSNGENYYDVRRANDDDEEGAWEYEPWSKRPWYIVPKSGRRRLTTLHQSVINQVIHCYWQPDHPLHKKGAKQ